MRQECPKAFSQGIKLVYWLLFICSIEVSAIRQTSASIPVNANLVSGYDDSIMRHNTLLSDQSINFHSGLIPFFLCGESQFSFANRRELAAFSEPSELRHDAHHLNTTMLSDHRNHFNSQSRVSYQDCIAAPAKTAPEFAQITHIFDKPKLEATAPNLAITGCYVLSSLIRNLLEFAAPRTGDEIQLTANVHHLLLLQRMQAYNIVGCSHDCANELIYL
jgi:hypothetical protein